jgi:hypothetical protein
MYLTRAFLNEPEFAAAAKEMEEKLKPHLIRLRYRLDEDWTGAPAVFFTAILPDPAFEWDNLSAAMARIADPITFELEPLEKWGVRPFFRYLSLSDVEKVNEPALA